jgi:hypothetical protein
MDDYSSCCLYRVDPPDDEQLACSKHIEAYYWNKLVVNSASCLFVLYWNITMHGQQNTHKKKINWYVKKFFFLKVSVINRLY